MNYFYGELILKSYLKNTAELAVTCILMSVLSNQFFEFNLSNVFLGVFLLIEFVYYLISSRSSSVKCCMFLIRGFGLMPPDWRKAVKTVPGAALRIRPMSLNPVPCFHKLKTKFFLSSVTVRFIRFIKCTLVNQYFNCNNLIFIWDLTQ